MHAQYFSGTANVVVPLRQRDFPEPFRGVSRLTYYASLFNSVEINSTFYKLPKAATVARWVTEVPGNFRFSFKLFKRVTHAGGLQFSQKDLADFMAAIHGAVQQKGAVLIQLPPSVKSDKLYEVQNLLETMEELNEEDQWPLAVEFRHASWYHHEMYRLLQRYKATIVVHDKRGAVTPITEEPENFCYLRFHGPDGRYGGTYPDEDLHDYAELINRALQMGKTVFCYFNNTLGGALSNCQTLRNYIQA